MVVGSLLGVLLLLGGVAWWLWERERSSRHPQREQGLCDAGDGAGCSLLVRHLRSEQELAALLAEERSCYEVIVVIDGAEQGDLLACLMDRYSLLRVEYRPAEEASVFGVRALYRSGRRPFRRLLLLDRASSEAADDWTAAAAVATWEWLLPLEGRNPLRPGAVGALMAAVEQSPRDDVEAVVSGDGVGVVSLDAVVAAGGFGPELERRLRRHRLRLRFLRLKGTKREK